MPQIMWNCFIITSKEIAPSQGQQKVYLEQIPKFEYFIEAGDENQQVYGTGYQIFDTII